MTALLMLGAGINQQLAIEIAKGKGHSVVAIDPDENAPGFATADYTYVCDLGDKEACLAIARYHNIDGVLTVASEYPMPLAAYLVDELSLHGLTQEVVAQATDKRLMRACFTKSGVPSPKSVAVLDVVQARECYLKFNSDVIFKPAKSHGGRGVTKLVADCEITLVDKAFQHAQGHSRNKQVLIEEFVAGDEYSVEAITSKGVTHIVAVTTKYTSGPPYYVEVAHTLPSALSPQIYNAVASIASNAVKALGIDDSPSHTELKVESDKIKIIEVGARLGGGFISSHLVPLATGVDLVSASIDMVLGKEPNVRPQYKKGAAMGFIRPEPGVISHISGIYEAQALENVVDARLYVGVGDRVKPLRDATGRIGHIIARGDSAEKAEQTVAEALELVAISTCSKEYEE